MNSYYNPVHTIEGAGSLNRLPEILKEMKPEVRRVLILAWSREALKHPAFSELKEKNPELEVRSLVFQASNPSVEQLFEAYEETKEFAPDAVAAIGGGSIMDVGKSLCCLYGKEIANLEELRELICSKAFGTPRARWIGIPTTAGTGSETTCWATIWDPEKDAKRSVENHENYACAALVDPELAATMPVKLAVSSALDALSHAVESYWARGTNCVSRALALQAVRIIMEHMDGLFEGSAAAHEAMARGSMLAGLAFSNTKTTACHSISYPLTMHYGIPHGTAVSLLLAPIFRLNASCTEGLEELLDALGAADPEELEGRIHGWLARSGQPATLREWGVRREDLPHLAGLGLTKGRADNNPAELTAEKVQRILEEIYEERPVTLSA